MTRMLTIGQVAKAADVSAKAIRHYEAVGVLARPPRTAGGYRQYGPRELERVRFVRRARALGLPLGQLRELAASFDGGARLPTRPLLRTLVRAQLLAVRRQRAELRLLERQLAAVQKRLARPPRPDGNGVCRCLGR
jgi:DNA-binding transcriptional MerR regulator